MWEPRYGNILGDQIEVSKRKSTNETNMELSKKPNLNVVRTLDYYINDTSLPAVLARMTACDGLSFNIFTTSLDLRRSLGALGHSIPKSVAGVRDQVVKYGQQFREAIKRSIHISKSKGEYFSLTFDEWTSVQNKRYLNINIHGNGFFWNLGLIRISGRFSSEACLNVIVQKLNEFGVNFEKDIVAITTDGCAMMKKLGRSIASPYQLCYAHGLQLVIQDIFYQKHNEDIAIFSDGCGTDDENNRTTLDHDSDDDLSDGLDISGHADSGNALALNLDIIETVNKVRRVVKIFKRSPLKNETLQKYVREKYPNGLNMILDCKTRWSSLVNSGVMLWERVGAPLP